MCPVSTSGCKELNSYQLLERRKQELLFTEKSAASPLAAPSPSLPALHDSNFRAEASSRPARLFTPGWTQHPCMGCAAIPGWALGTKGPSPATEPRQEATTLTAAAGQAKSLTSHREEASLVHSKACSDSAVACPGMPGTRYRAGITVSTVPHGWVIPVLPAPAPVSAALLQPQLLEAASTFSAPSTCDASQDTIRTCTPLGLMQRALYFTAIFASKVLSCKNAEHHKFLNNGFSKKIVADFHTIFVFSNITSQMLQQPSDSKRGTRVRTGQGCPSHLFPV